MKHKTEWTRIKTIKQLNSRLNWKYKNGNVTLGRVNLGGIFKNYFFLKGY
jgi:hypothetical protein